MSDPRARHAFEDVCHQAEQQGKPYVLNPFEAYIERADDVDHYVIKASNDFIPYAPGANDLFLTPRKHVSMAFSDDLMALIMAGYPVCSVAKSDAFMFIPVAYCVRFPNDRKQIEFALKFEDHDDYEVSKAK